MMFFFVNTDYNQFPSIFHGEEVIVTVGAYKKYKYSFMELI